MRENNTEGDREGDGENKREREREREKRDEHDDPQPPTKSMASVASTAYRSWVLIAFYGRFSRLSESSSLFRDFPTVNRRS